MPVLGLVRGYTPASGGNVTMPSVGYGMKILSQNVQGIIVPNSGHWIPEERPDFVIKMLDNFFGGNTNFHTKIFLELFYSYSILKQRNESRKASVKSL